MTSNILPVPLETGAGCDSAAPHRARGLTRNSPTISAKREHRSASRAPRIPLELGVFELTDIFRTKLENRTHVEIQIAGGKRFQVGLSELEEAASRTQTHSVGRMHWTPVLFLQRNKSAGQLNQPFEKLVRWARGSQPEMLKNVVCFIVLLFIEADKIPFVTGIVSRSDV